MVLMILPGTTQKYSLNFPYLRVLRYGTQYLSKPNCCICLERPPIHTVCPKTPAQIPYFLKTYLKRLHLHPDVCSHDIMNWILSIRAPVVPVSQPWPCGSRSHEGYCKLLTLKHRTLVHRSHGHHSTSRNSSYPHFRKGNSSARQSPDRPDALGISDPDSPVLYLLHIRNTCVGKLE